ncbi:MAG TPA: dihydroxyacetone kinase phosphoryl donor subunit DhaM [Pseudolysinimonas sp.]
MIGIVVVSHSPKLAEAAYDLAREMVPKVAPRVALAAGTGDGLTGTDATRVAAAIVEVASPDDVLVLMDLGSAVLSAELALEFAGDIGGEVRLSSAPIVEGLLAAVVRAAGGASLDEVDREARNALAAKESQLGHPEYGAAPKADPVPAPADGSTEERFVLPNPEGLHARPASLIVTALGGLDAKVTVRTGDKKPVDGRSPIGLMALGARQGDEIVVSASGPQAADALAAVRELIATSFGE